MELPNTTTTRPDSRTSGSPVNVLLVNASSRFEDSITRQLTEEMVEELDSRYGINRLTIRDVARVPLPVIDESWVNANFTRPENRSDAQRKKLALSDELVNEVRDADVIVIGVPIYNFGIPAALKAWIDLVARAGLTFRYTSDGPVGLLEGKHAFVVVASGGVAVDSEVDFATPHIRQVLKFIGINAVSVVSAERLNSNSEAGQRAEQAIKQIAADYQDQQGSAA